MKVMAIKSKKIKKARKTDDNEWNDSHKLFVVYIAWPITIENDNNKENINAGLFFRINSICFISQP